MNINSAEAHELAKELAALEHTTITDAVVLSLKEAIDRRQERRAAHTRLEAAQAVASRMQLRITEHPGPSLWDIAEDLYDEQGLPK